MSSLRNNINSTPTSHIHDLKDSLHLNGYRGTPPRSRTPISLSLHPNSTHGGSTADGELGADEDPKISVFRELYARSEARLASLFAEQSEERAQSRRGSHNQRENERAKEQDEPAVRAPPKKPARTIDEDDYDDSDEEEGEPSLDLSPLKLKSTGTAVVPARPSTPTLGGASKYSIRSEVKSGPALDPNKTSEDARKQLEEDKKATEDAAKRTFHTLFYTLENDHDALLDQQRLEESEQQVEVEMLGQRTGAPNGEPQRGTLSQSNLGASSLTLKHLIARIDSKRNLVEAKDAELKSLLQEVRRNRSKWASEEKIGQEELYEAAEKVLNELKAITVHSSPFLTRVNKRDAPDYYNGIP